MSAYLRKYIKIFFLLFILVIIAVRMNLPLGAEEQTGGLYNPGKPIVNEIWVDPIKGKDTNNGAVRQKALHTLAAAWELIPSGKVLTNKGYRIMLAAGDYPADSLPANGWMEKRYGTYQYPVIIQAADGAGSVHIHGYFNIYDCRYLYLIGLDFATDPGTEGGGDVIHIEQSNHILINSSKLNGSDGRTNLVQETLKINQSQYIYIENNDISGAFWFALDFVAVEYGHIRGNRIHNSGDDCMLLKGGTAYFQIEGNEIYDSGNVGFAAGQGTGFEFMVSPWIHYEVYHLKFINNVIHDTQNAGMAVRGGYNVLLAHNTLYKIGINEDPGAPLLLISPGARSCDGNVAECKKWNAAGGWGPKSGDAGECIPNRNVYIYNNIFYNPAPAQTKWSHFQIFGPVTSPSGTNIPSPVLSDNNLRICGNIIWNGPADFPIGIEEENQGAQPSNPTCNEKLLRADNKFNTLQPQMIDPANHKFQLSKEANIVRVPACKIPKFPEKDPPLRPLAPSGEPNNLILNDYNGKARSASPAIGAFE